MPNLHCSFSLSLSLSFFQIRRTKVFFSLNNPLSRERIRYDQLTSTVFKEEERERSHLSLSLSLSRVDAAAATHFFSLFSSFLLFFFSSQKDFLEIWKLKIKWPFEKRKVEELEELEVQEKWEEEEEEREVKTQFWRDWSSSSSAFSFQLQRRRRAKSEWLLRNAERRSRRRKERKDSWKCSPHFFSKGISLWRGNLSLCWEQKPRSAWADWKRSLKTEDRRGRHLVMNNPNQYMGAQPSGFRTDMQAGPSSVGNMMGSPQQQGFSGGVGGVGGVTDPGQAQQMMQMQQMMQQQQQQDPNMAGTTYTGPYPWKQGVCECTQSGDICMEGLFCLPCLYGSTVSKVQGVPCIQPTVAFAFSMLFCMCAFVGAKSRRDVRVKFNLVAEPFSDCLTYFLYPFCTVCQEAYELRARGFGSQFGPPGGMGGMMMGGGMPGMMMGMNGGMGMNPSAMMSPPGQMAPMNMGMNPSAMGFQQPGQF